MAVFYQIYRPQDFDSVLGQDHIVSTLKQAVRLGKVGHAYLFTGSRGVGKTTIARILAKSLNCTKLVDGNPCGKCDGCIAIAKGSFLDVIEIDAASHTGVDHIRELIEKVQFAPSLGNRKVFIIDEVHMLSKSAFNALLKTLEEPPEHVVFILATTDIEKVPDTIISRTQRFDFRKIGKAQILEALQAIVKKEKLQLPNGALEIIVENCEGGLRDALSQLSMLAVLEKDHGLEDVHLLLGTTSELTVLELLQIIASGQHKLLPKFFEDLTANNFDASQFVKKVLAVLQQLLAIRLGHAGELYTELSNQFSLVQVLYVTRLFLRSYKEIETSPSPELPVLLASIEAALYMSGGKGDPKNDANTTENQSNAKQETNREAMKENSPQVVEVMTAQIHQESDASKESDINLSPEQVQVWWPELVERMKVVNSPLSTLLKNSPLHEVSKNRVSVSVKFLFHKEHLEQSKHRFAISQILSEKAGGPVEFRAVIVKDSVGEKIADTAQAVGDAIKIFGGELID